MGGGASAGGGAVGAWVGGGTGVAVGTVSAAGGWVGGGTRVSVGGGGTGVFVGVGGMEMAISAWIVGVKVGNGVRVGGRLDSSLDEARNGREEQAKLTKSRNPVKRLQERMDNGNSKVFTSITIYLYQPGSLA